jgi:hypothetical protein
MRIGKVLLLAMTLTLGVSTAFAQSIDITLDAAGTICEAAIPGATVINIIARPAGVLATGFTQAEFWVQGLPTGWFAIASPNPLAAATTLGSPFATTSPFRTNIAFPSCQAPDGNGVVSLFTVTLIPVSFPADAYLSVVVADPPTNELFTTPILYGCDAEFTPVPAKGGQFIMNPTTKHCTVSVENTTWSEVKSLYNK